MDNKVIEKITNKRPLIISGPCSAETEEQLLQTAAELALTGKVDILRAGIWKPRTRPGSFEGVGVKGLSWMQEAKKKTGLPCATEVATAGQVNDALLYNIDVLWVGARTTVNPFSVQEIADSLSGIDIPVFIKNPINPDLELWTGAVERIRKAGISTIGLIHRGFSSYGNNEFRNAPMWHLAIEMKRRHPELMMLCDPSHICGVRSTIPAVIQKAVDLDYEGLIIESHINPDEAWSDPKQQVTPHLLVEILEQIIWRTDTSDKEEFINILSALREQINQIDEELLSLLGRRMGISEKIGECKKENQITILQTARWNEIFAKTLKKGKKLGLSSEFITKYLEALHVESIRHQNKIMNNRD